MISPQIIGRNLKRLRKQEKVTQVEMGVLLELHQTAICRVERGEQHLTASQILFLMWLFRVNGKYFEKDAG